MTSSQRVRLPNRPRRRVTAVPVSVRRGTGAAGISQDKARYLAEMSAIRGNPEAARLLGRLQRARSASICGELVCSWLRAVDDPEGHARVATRKKGTPGRRNLRSGDRKKSCSPYRARVP